MLLGVFASCNHIDNKVLPSYTVRIDLGTYGVWNTYGVTGVGDYRIFSRDKQLPANFPYNANTFTGFGGVLLWRISWTIEAEAPVPNGLGLFCLVELEEHCTTTLEFQPFSIIPVKQ